jgi:hypothetical protein
MASPIPMPLATGALLARPNRAQASGPPRAQHPVPDWPWPSWLAKVAEPPSPTTSLQPAPAVSLPLPRLGFAVSCVAHVKSRVRSASPCSRSRRCATIAYSRSLTRSASTGLRPRSSTPCLPSSTPRIPSSTPPPPCAFASLASPSPAHRALKSSRAVRARCACRSHASSCASSHVNNLPHLE